MIQGYLRGEASIVLRRQRSSESGAPSTTVRSLRELQWSPSPASRGRMARALAFSQRTRARGLPTKATNSLRLKEMKGGGAPKRRNCLVGPRHAADVAIRMRFGRGRAFSGTRSPFGAPPRRSLWPIAEARSGPRFTRCSAQALAQALASRLSEAPRAPVVMPAGSMPGPPESGSDEPPPAGTAPTPSVGVTG